LVYQPVSNRSVLNTSVGPADKQVSRDVDTGLRVGLAWDTRSADSPVND
jgi:hypothetical protein